MVVTLCLILLMIVAAFTVTVSAESDAPEKSYQSLEVMDSNTGASVEQINTSEISESTSGAAITAGISNEDDKAEVNVSNLETIIAYAQSIFDSAEEGDTAGKYSIASKEILKEAIDNAKAVLDDNTVTQEQIDSEAEKLQVAVNVFTASAAKLIGDLNNDFKLDIFDLYIISLNLFNDDWDSAKAADINQDGKIDMEDSWLISKNILN